jgi:hypothetical protein
MLKEAIIWATLIMGFIISVNVIAYLDNVTKKKANLITTIFFIFIGLFCGIYLIFRFFWYLTKITTGIQ